MKRRSRFGFGISRALIIGLIIVIAAALFTLAVSATRKTNRANEPTTIRPVPSSSAAINNRPTLQPVSPLIPAITATLSDNTPLATKVNPGATINYAATINNGGTDATGVTFNDVLDNNTTLVGGSLHASPIAFDDTYNWVGNTVLDTSARGLASVAVNDVAVTDSFTVTTINNGATTQGGTVTLASNGHFVYTPQAGDTAVADTFTYTITNNADGTLVGTATVTINLIGRVWYVQNTLSNGNGTSGSPFNNPASASTAASLSSDIIYIFSDVGANPKLNGNFLLDSGQQLLGQGVSLVVNSITLFTAGPAPTTTNTGGNGVTLASGNTLAGFLIGNCSGTAISGSDVGTLNINNLTVNTTGAGLDLTGVSTPTVNVALSSLTSSGGTKNVNLVGLNGTINLGSGALSGASGNAFDVSGGAATVSYSGTITNTAAARLINIANKTGGTVSFSGALSGTGSSTGINLSSNTGATISFSGGITLSTGANAAFTATGGGTVNATQNNTTIVNNLTTTTGTALNVANTTIGASNLTFHSISANGGANGIVLNNTGSSGSLVVTGNGNTSVGGDNSGGTIQNVTANAISLTSTLSPSFTNINIQSAGRSGIDGQSVTNFTLTSSTINNVGTAAAGQYEESNIAFNDGGAFTGSSITGAVSITKNTLSNARRHGIDIENGTGTISNLTISNNTLTSSTSAAVSLGNGILVLQQGSASTTSHLTTGTISSNTITNFPSGAGILVGGGSGNGTNNSSATLGANGTPISITGNSISGASAANRMGTNAIQVSFNGQVGVSNFTINNNPTLTNFAGIGITVFMGGSVTGTTNVNNNVMVSNNTAGSSGIAVQADDGPAGLGTSQANYNFTINGNNISANDGNCIRAIARASLAIMDVTIQNNTVTAPSTSNRNGIRVDSGSAAGDVTLCMTMTGNTSDGSGSNNGIGIRKQGTVATVNDFGIVGLSPSPTTAANAAAKVNSDNPAGGGVDVISGDNFVSCTISPLAPPVEASVLPGDAPFTSPQSVAYALPAMFGGYVSNPFTFLTSVSNFGQDASMAQSKVKPDETRIEGNGDQFDSMPQQEPESGTSSARSNWAPLPGFLDRALSSIATFANAFGSMIVPTAYAEDAESTSHGSNEATNSLSGETVNVNIGTLPAGKSITIKYQATVSSTPTAASVSTQGTVAGANFANVLTNDPETAAANDATVTQIALPDLTITKTHSGTFTQGETGKTYTITVTNSGDFATLGSTVTVSDTIPSGLTATGINGTGWNCTQPAGPCTRSDVLNVAASYEPITLTVSVDNNAAASVTNTATVSGGGEFVTNNNTANDQTSIIQVPDLTISKNHSGSFFQGQVGAQYTITVSNAGPGPVVAGNTVSVSDTIPTGLTATAINGTGWNCTQPAGPCTRTDALAVSGNYPALTLTVDVANNAPTGVGAVTNTANVSGGGELNTANNTVNDPTTISSGPDLTITKTHTGNFTQGDTGASYTITVTNSGGSPTVGTVTVTDTVPTGLTATAISGTGWTCTPPSGPCSRSDALAAGNSYPDLTLTVDVSSTAPASVVNTATVSGGGDVNAGNNTANDTTTINPLCTPAPANLVAWWPGDGNAKDVAGGHDGTPQGNATFAAGEVLQAFSFDGDGDFVQAADSAAWDFGTDAFTIDLWVNFTQVNSTNTLVAHDDGPGSTNKWIFWLNNGNLEFHTNDTLGSSQTVNVPFAPTPATWYHLAVKRSGSSYTFYINGVPSAPITQATAVPDASAVLTIGAAEGGNFVNGLLDEVEIFSSALSDAEILSIFNAGTGGKCKPSDLTITKTHSGNFNQGDAAQNYTITVSNEGPAATTGTVTVTDIVPTGLTATAIGGTGWNCTQAAGPCTRTDALNPGDSYPALTLTVSVAPNAPSSVTNTATVAGGGELDTSDDSVDDQTAILSPSLTVTKTADFASVLPGSAIGFTVVVSNSNAPGTATAIAATLSDPLPAGTGVNWSISPAYGGPGTCTIGAPNQSLSCAFGDLAPGAQASVHVTSATDSSSCGVYANTATAAADNHPNVQGIATTTVQCADLTIAKTHTGKFAQGQTGATYTITVSNVGVGPSSGEVTVSDTVPATLTATGIAGTGWNCTQPAGPCSRSDALAAGNSYAPIVLTVDVPANAPSSVINSASVSGGNDVTPGNNTVDDSTVITPTSQMWTNEGSTGTVDEDSQGIVSFSNFVVGLQTGQTGTATVRYNITPTRDISRFCPATSSNIQIRFRDSDAAGGSAQILFTIRRSSIYSGGNTTLFTFDSNASALPLGAVFQTFSAVAPIDFDFANNIYWIEAQISRTDANAFVNLGSVQIFESAGPACRN